MNHCNGYECVSLSLNGCRCYCARCSEIRESDAFAAAEAMDECRRDRRDDEQEERETNIRRKNV